MIAAPRGAVKFCLALWLAMTFAGCAPLTQKTGPHILQPALEAGHYVTADGVRLPLSKHAPVSSKAIIVALHGFNDYRTEFDMAAQWWVRHGVTTYAYDQRGFGGAPQRGVWPGPGILADDARNMIALARAAHPGQPVYLLGMSMGGAVALELAGSANPPDVDGVIVAAPAVWGWSTLNPIYKGALWLAAHTVRGYKLTGQQLEIVVSDNIEMLRALGRDPMIIRATRADAVYGLVGQMERGYQAAPRVSLPLLLLYGEKDEVIPRRPIEDVIAALPGAKRVIVYPDGYHMLLRDLQAESVWRDIAAFMDRGTPPVNQTVSRLISH